jgi:hypothetical protein
VILAAVPGSKGDDVRGGLWTDDVRRCQRRSLEGARLVVEQLGGVHRESRDGGGVDQAEPFRRTVVLVRVWGRADDVVVRWPVR